MKKATAILMAVISIFYAMSISVYAEEAETVTVTVGNTDFTFDASTTEEFRSKAIASILNEEDDGAQTYGVMCDLIGHAYESSSTTATTHKARSTAPRCLVTTYNLQICRRCEHTIKTVARTDYIYCC